ncbi:MAG: thioredoxin family protein [Promethearchaeota archaeon]
MKEIKGKNDFQESISSAKVVVIDFSAVWCGPCQMLTPILEKLSEEMEGAGKDVKFFGCDVDENREIAMEFNISAVPSVGIFKNGKLNGGLVIGVRGKDAYENTVNELLKD